MKGREECTSAQDVHGRGSAPSGIEISGGDRVELRRFSRASCKRRAFIG